MKATAPACASAVAAVGLVLAGAAWFTFRKKQGMGKTSSFEEHEKRGRDYLPNPEKVPNNIDLYDMRLYWYPVRLSSLVTAKKPVAIKLLGEPLVLYRASDGSVVCAEDRCPHRSARLSLGNMRNGNLECQYHGWQFGENGQCKRIPSVKKDSKFHSRVCAATKPCKEVFGLVWVWPGDPSLASEEMIPRYLFRESDFGEMDFFEDCQDLDIPHDLMVDNLMDFAHLDFTHDGTLGKRSAASYVEMKHEENYLHFKQLHPHSESYSASKPYREKQGPVFTFVPPCFVRLELWKGDRCFIQVFANVPAEEDRMTFIARFYQTFIPSTIVALIPKSIQHRASNRILGQDLDMLLGIKSNVQSGARYYSKIVLADILIKKYRSWYAKAMEKQPFFTGWSADVGDIEDLS